MLVFFFVVSAVLLMALRCLCAIHGKQSHGFLTSRCWGRSFEVVTSKIRAERVLEYRKGQLAMGQKDANPLG